MRANTLIVLGLAGLFVVAAADALRSRETEPSPDPASAIAACDADDVAAALEHGRPGALTLRLRAPTGARCRLSALPLRVRVEDRSAVVVYDTGLFDRVSGIVDGERGVTTDVGLPSNVECGEGGPFVAVAVVGANRALRTIPGQMVGCPSPDESEVTRRRVAYVARALALCTAATARFERDTSGLLPPDGLRDVVRWNAAAAEASERTLRRLDALSRPTRNDAALDVLFGVMEEEIELLRETANAALVGAEGATATISRRRVVTTERKDRLVSELAERWGVTTRGLHECPLRLPA